MFGKACFLLEGISLEIQCIHFSLQVRYCLLRATHMDCKLKLSDFLNCSLFNIYVYVKVLF